MPSCSRTRRELGQNTVVDRDADLQHFDANHDGPGSHRDVRRRLAFRSERLVAAIGAGQLEVVGAFVVGLRRKRLTLSMVEELWYSPSFEVPRTRCRPTGSCVVPVPLLWFSVCTFTCRMLLAGIAAVDPRLKYGHRRVVVEVEFSPNSPGLELASACELETSSAELSCSSLEPDPPHAVRAKTDATTRTFRTITVGGWIPLRICP